MAYVKTTWQTGDIVTAEKLNNLENGVASAVNGWRVLLDEPVQEDVFIKLNGTVAGAGDAFINSDIDYTLINSNNVYMLMVGSNNYPPAIVGYNVLVAEEIDSSEVAQGSYYIEGGTVMVMPFYNEMEGFLISSENSIKEGTAPPK